MLEHAELARQLRQPQQPAGLESKILLSACSLTRQFWQPEKSAATGPGGLRQYTKLTK